MRNRKPKEKRKKKHEKLRQKEFEIRKSNNVVAFDDITVENVMNKYNIEDYKIEVWGDISVKSKIDNWLIKTDGVVIALLHENAKIARVGNERSSWHIHNLFYDLDYCVKSIVKHDEYVQKE